MAAVQTADSVQTADHRVTEKEARPFRRPFQQCSGTWWQFIPRGVGVEVVEAMRSSQTLAFEGRARRLC